MKQETLEEAAEKEYPTIHEQYQYDAFIEGAKWQQERSYSEEEVLEFGKYLLELSNSAMSKRTKIKMLDLETGEKLVKDLIEQFKKK
jgi:hypothetical protein